MAIINIVCSGNMSFGMLTSNRASLVPGSVNATIVSIAIVVLIRVRLASMIGLLIAPATLFFERRTILFSEQKQRSPEVNLGQERS